MTEALVKCPICYRQFWIRAVPDQEHSRAVPPHSSASGRCSGSGRTAPIVDRRSR